MRIPPHRVRDRGHAVIINPEQLAERRVLSQRRKNIDDIEEIRAE